MVQSFSGSNFKDAVNQNLLSDYRVILMGVDENSIPKGLQRQLVALADEEEETNYFRPKAHQLLLRKKICNVYWQHL